MPTAIIIGIGSDIGRELALRLTANGWTVNGTYRSQRPATAPAVGLVCCDLASSESVAAALESLRSRSEGWELLVIAAGTEEPIGTFWECDAEEWDRGIDINALAPLRLVRGLYPVRSQASKASVAFFAGAGTNSAAPAYSAYCVSKILLIKMCELLNAESSDTSFFIVGPGMVRTKIHEQTLSAPERSGSNYEKVVDFLESRNPGTNHDDIYACVQWCMSVGKEVVGGRNISLVHDAWKKDGLELAKWLEQDPNRYKLRRHGNDDSHGR